MLSRGPCMCAGVPRPSPKIPAAAASLDNESNSGRLAPATRGAPGVPMYRLSKHGGHASHINAAGPRRGSVMGA
ncbi:hypothetical protein IscW_ISCW023753 [Ixodes scapularis]|uniref:Uncharacterized protein n=1 Tax=Ixodes scapularis TaxID=6945 RepID=B7QIM7_IXOSC|nr:hypothetical protein IscW_ISCW023753 [Ixodes scapularis]|eukprot:XP_002415034.1 hypothetical protein IscW_ISCW023753 [Ixodes scapularis]